MIVELYLKHKKLMRQLTQTDIISDTATRDWTQRYKQGGTEGLRNHRTWKHYSQVLKEQQAIRDYLEAKTSQYNIVTKLYF